MRTLAIDIETYSSVSLKEAGVYAYAESPDFTVLLFGYAWDDEPAKVVDLTVDHLSPELVAALTDRKVLKTAYNAAFERVCLAAYLGQPMPPEQWQCTAVWAAELGLPKSLEAVGEVVGSKHKKDKGGAVLIKQFCLPGGKPKTPESWQAFIDYCRQDVETERAIKAKLAKMPLHPMEAELWVHDQHINDRGVLADVEFAQQALDIDTVVKSRLLDAAIELTGMENPKSAAQIKTWIEEKSGVAVPTLLKRELSRMSFDNEEVEAFLDIRQDLAKISTQKYSAALRTVCRDGRIRGLTQFYGANRTGRWAGRLVQTQNMPRSGMSAEDFDRARQLVRAGKLEEFQAEFPRAAKVLSELTRSIFIAAPGMRFLIADFSAIEARVLSWLAGEEWRLEVFRSHGKIYEATAAKMFKIGIDEVTPERRQKGKIAELACGYGGSVGALMNMGAVEMGLKERELKAIVNTWRSANPNIVKFWYAVDAAARDTISTGRVTELGHGIQFSRKGPLLLLRLPSGRSLSYVTPKIADKQIIFDGTAQTGGGWCKIETYGAKLVENITQAVARDCLAEAIARLERLGIPVVFHVHDEVICEVRQNEWSPESLVVLMTELVPWMEDLPLAAHAYESAYYRKE